MGVLLHFIHYKAETSHSTLGGKTPIDRIRELLPKIPVRRDC